MLQTHVCGFIQLEENKSLLVYLLLLTQQSAFHLIFAVGVHDAFDVGLQGESSNIAIADVAILIEI